MPRASFGWDLALRMEKGHRMKEHSLVLVLGAWRPLMLNAITPWSFIQRMVGLKHWLPPRADAAWDTIQGNDPVFKPGFGVVGDTLVYDRSDVFARGETFINCASADSPYTPAYRDWETDRKSTRLNSSHRSLSRMPSSA